MLALLDQPETNVWTPRMIWNSRWVHTKSWNGPEPARTGLKHNWNTLNQLTSMFTTSWNTMKPYFYPPEPSGTPQNRPEQTLEQSRTVWNSLEHHENILKLLKIMFAVSWNNKQPYFFPRNHLEQLRNGLFRGVKNTASWYSKTSQT